MNRDRRSWALRRTKILRASRFKQNRPRIDDGNVGKGRVDGVGVSKLDGSGRCIFLLQSPNLNAASATAFSGQVLASPSFLVASVKL